MKFTGHETFFIRKGWLFKGLKYIEQGRTNIFVDKQELPTDVLGIGTSMVKSLRYWMQCSGLTREEKEGSINVQHSTEFGDIVWEHDRYMEEEGTLWLIHYHIASNINLATTWYWFFNEFKVNEFTSEDFLQALNSYIKFNSDIDEVAMNSLKDCYNCLINTYISKNKLTGEKISPENNIDSPLGNLGLISVVDRKKKIYQKAKMRKNSIHPLIILAVIVNENTNHMNSLNIAKLINDKNNVCKIFNMDSNILNYYLTRLEQMNYIKVIRTAGLDVIKFNREYSFVEIIEEYYNALNENIIEEGENFAE